ncbi:hypothetical protein EON65_22425 [archaeon]|nr:MAG: hypothetical protein EON65_22425 [archaeon]
MSSVFKDSRTDPTEGSEEDEDESREEDERSADSASTSSNDLNDLSSSVKDIHSQDARWAQMKRNAQKKKAHKGLDRLKVSLMITF